MPNYRRARINDEFLRVVSDAIRTVKDPRVASEFITVTQCEVTGDLKYAKIYFSVFGADEEKIKDILRGLKSATGVIRHEVAVNLNLRITPELQFIYDNAMERGAAIAELLKKTHVESLSAPDGGEGDE